MCSLAAQVTKGRIEDHDTLARSVCNELNLDYTYSHAAMLSPMQWSSRIWAGLPPIDLDTAVKGQTLTQFAQCVYDRIPKSLIYSNHRIVFDDIVKTLRTATRAVGKY